MSKYLIARLHNNSFYVKASGSLLGESFEEFRFKLDTGCSFSTVPARRLFFMKDEEYKGLKEHDLRKGVEYKESYGVESGGRPHKALVTFEDKLNSSAIKFRHRLSNFCVNGYNLPDLDIWVNYNRLGNILIGMDILSQFDIHIGLSNVTNNVVLLGVLKTQEDKTEYNKALFRHFGLVREETLLADGLRQVFKDMKDE